MSNLVFKNADGTIAVVHLTPEFIELHGSEDKALEVEAARIKFRGGVAPDAVEVGRKVELPADREFRNAWDFITPEPCIDICPHKAVELTKNRLRAERAPLLAKLDVDFMRATEAIDSAKMKEIAEKKQALRDITATVAVPAEMLGKPATPAFLESLKQMKATAE